MANESDEAMAFNDTTTPLDVPVYLKQSVPMIVVYAVAYSSVFFLGKNIISDVYTHSHTCIVFGSPEAGST